MNRFTFHRLVVYTFLSLVLISCYTSTEPVAFRADRIPVNEKIIPDNEVVELISAYKTKVDAETSKVIGYSDQLLMKGKPESSLTNFVADIMLEKGIEIAKKNNQPIPAISFSNSSGLRSSLPMGAITVGDVFKLMPFENKLVVLGLTQNELMQFLNEIAADGGDGLGGICFVINKGKAEQVTVAGVALNNTDNKMYYMVTTDFLANGGGGEVLKNASIRYDYNTLFRDAIIDKIKQINTNGEKLNVPLDGRIKVISGTSSHQSPY